MAETRAAFKDAMPSYIGIRAEHPGFDLPDVLTVRGRPVRIKVYLSQRLLNLFKNMAKSLRVNDMFEALRDALEATQQAT